MADGISIKIDTEKISKQLSRLEKKVGSLKSLYEEIGEALVNSTRQRFRRGIDPDGNPWEPLSERTKQERRGSEPYKILLDTGRLRDSIIEEAEDDRLRVGTNVKYAPIHQIGGINEEGFKVPARPFLGLSAGDRIQIGKIIRKYFKEIEDA